MGCFGGNGGDSCLWVIVLILILCCCCGNNGCGNGNGYSNTAFGGNGCCN